MIRKFLMVPILLSAFVLIGSGSSAADKAEVVVFPLLQEKSPLISFRVIWFTGAKEDPAGKKGLSALCAATVANGGTTELSREEVLGKLYPMAAEISHQTDKEMVVFTGSVHRDLLDDFYSVFSSLLLRPRFDPADFKREKEGLLNYLKNNLRGTADEQLGKEILDLEVHRGHPYGSCNQGKISDLENISLGDVKEYWRDSFVRSRIQWGIAGDFPESLLKSIQRDFGILPGESDRGKYWQSQVLEKAAK